MFCGFNQRRIVFIFIVRFKSFVRICHCCVYIIFVSIISSNSSSSSSRMHRSEPSCYSPEVECRCYYCHRCRMKSHKGYIIHSFLFIYFSYASSSSFVFVFGWSHNVYIRRVPCYQRLLVLLIFFFCFCLAFIYYCWLAGWLIWCS